MKLNKIKQEIPVLVIQKIQKEVHNRVINKRANPARGAGTKIKGGNKG